MKQLLCLLLALLMIAALTACSGGVTGGAPAATQDGAAGTDGADSSAGDDASAPAEGTSVDVLTWSNAATVEYLKSIADAFHEAYPDHYLTVSEVPSAEIDQVIQTRISAANVDIVSFQTFSKPQEDWNADSIDKPAWQQYIDEGLLLDLTAFPAAASGETSDRVMFVQCDTQNMTANFYFTPNPGAYWSEMGIYTEPQDGWDQDSSGKLVRLSNIVPSSLWRVGPSSMTDGDGKVNGTQILDSHFEFTAGVTYYVYMCYYDGANWNVIPDYYSFVFEDGPADGDVFDEDQLVLHADMNNTKITTDAGAGSFFEVTFDSIYASGTPDDGCYRRDFNQNVKRNASSTVLGIDNNGGEIGISFQGYRWNGGGTDENFYFTGEAEGCDGIYLISKTGETARAEVEYSLYRYQVIIPAGFDGYVSIPNTRIGKGNSEESVGNYDHSADQYILYWSPSLFVQTKTADAADVNFNAFGSLFYKVGENAPVPGDDAADQIEELLGELPESINAANM